MNTGEGGSQANNSKIGCDRSEISGIFEMRDEQDGVGVRTGRTQEH